MKDIEIDAAQIRHINLSGDMYSRLVFGEEDEAGGYLYQKHIYQEDRLIHRILNKIFGKQKNFIMPRFRKLEKNKPYIYVVSLWGNVDDRKSILRRLYDMKKKHKKMLIVGYWGDPGFSLDPYDGYDFDLLITSQEPHMRKWPNLKFLHFPVASLGLLGEESKDEYDCFSIGTNTSLRLTKTINAEEQFKKHNIKAYYCIAGLQADEEQNNRINSIRKYRDFPDREFMHPDETLAMCKKTRVLLNISRLPDAYEASPSFYAIMFNKKLIIDSGEIKKNPYYDERYMKIVDFTKQDWLTPDLVKWIKKPEKIDYGYKGEWEAHSFYRDVRNLLKAGD